MSKSNNEFDPSLNEENGISNTTTLGGLETSGSAIVTYYDCPDDLGEKTTYTLSDGVRESVVVICLKDFQDGRTA